MTLKAISLSVALGGKTVLNDISASFETGRVTAILGPNGAGKTSLMRAMLGLCTPVSGSVELDGLPLAEIDRQVLARRLGYLPQETSTVWNLQVRDMVALGRLPHRASFGHAIADDQAIAQALSDTKTAALADRPINALSGGERARVHFARLLAGEPDWILADEPLANLDPPYQRDMLALLRASARQGKGVAVILHGLNAAARVADDIVLMANGTIVAAGSKQDVLNEANLAQTYGMDFRIHDIEGQTVIKPRD